MQKRFNPQVDKKGYYYTKSYNTLTRFCSYSCQVNLLLDLLKEKADYQILEIGVGSKLVNHFLKEKGVDITSCDFDKKLKPDILADIRNLPFVNDSFDIVIAYEVLEHIPFEDFRRALREMKRVSRKYLVLSFPYSRIFFELVVNIKIPYHLRKIFTLPLLRVPFWTKHKFSPEHNHYWEVGKRGYLLKKIRNIFKELGLTTVKEVYATINSYHYFVVLEK